MTALILTLPLLWAGPIAPREGATVVNPAAASEISEVFQATLDQSGGRQLLLQRGDNWVIWAYSVNTTGIELTVASNGTPVRFGNLRHEYDLNVLQNHGCLEILHFFDDSPQPQLVDSKLSSNSFMFRADCLTPGLEGSVQILLRAGQSDSTESGERRCVSFEWTIIRSDAAEEVFEQAFQAMSGDDFHLIADGVEELSDVNQLKSEPGTGHQTSGAYSNQVIPRRIRTCECAAPTAGNRLVCPPNPNASDGCDQNCSRFGGGGSPGENCAWYTRTVWLM